MKFNLVKKNPGTFFLLLCGVFFSLPAFRLIPPFADPDQLFWGVDYPYAWMINHLVSVDFSAIQNTFFPHGALGFVQYAWPISDKLTLAWILIILQRCILGFLLYKFTANLESISLRLFLVFFTLLFFNYPQGLSLQSIVLIYQIIRNFNTLSHTIFKAFSDKFLYTLILIFTWVLSFYTRLFPFIISTAGIGVLMIYALIKSDLKYLRLLVLNGIGGLLFICGVWLLLFQNLDSLFLRLYFYVELMRGGAFATSVYPTNHSLVLGLSFLLLFAFIFKHFKKFEIAILFLVYFLIFKYAFVTENYPHTVQVLKLIHWPLILVSLQIKKDKIIGLILLVLSGVLFAFNLGKISGKYFPLPVASFAEHPLRYVFDSGKASQRFELLTKPQIEKHKWPEAEKIAGQKQVTAFPFDYIYPIANKGNLVPTPVSQSYVAYTPFLDEKQSEFFRGEEAPQYIYFHQGFGFDNKYSLGRHYFPFVAPETQRVIANRYHVVLKRDDVWLLAKSDNTKRLANNLDVQEKFLKIDFDAVGEFIPVDSMKEGFKMNLVLNFRGKLRSFLYKPPRVMCELSFSDQQKRTYEINILHPMFYFDTYRFHDTQVVGMKLLVIEKQMFYFK